MLLHAGTSGSETKTSVRSAPPVLVTTIWKGTVSPLEKVRLSGPSACLRISIEGTETASHSAFSQSSLVPSSRR